MARYYVIVNDTERIPLFEWNALGFKNVPQLYLATDNLTYVRQVFANIRKISVVTEDDDTVAIFTEYDGFDSILYLGEHFSSQMDTFAHKLAISFTKVSLVDQVQRLDEQVNHVIDTEAMDIDQFKEYKIDLISKAGEQIIFNGTDVTLLNGVVKNFTYNLEDQSNLLNAIFIIQTLGDLDIALPYHSHGEPCELYNAKDILGVYFTLQFFSTRVQTEINMKLNWIRSCSTKEEIENITIETPLPTEWASRAAAIMGPTLQLAAQLQEQYLGPVEPFEPVIIEEEGE